MAVVALAIIAVALVSVHEVVDEGYDLRPYGTDKVWQVEFAGAVTVYVDEESKVTTDSVTGSLLVLLATASIMAFLLLRAASGPRRLRLFYGLAGAAFAYLAVDEFAGVHETIGHNLVFLTDLPGVERPDDAIFAAYLIPAVIFVIYFRDVFLKARGGTLALLAAACVSFAAAGAADIAGLTVDEALEGLTALLMVAAFLSLVAKHLTGLRFATPVVNPSGNVPTGVDG